MHILMKDPENKYIVSLRISLKTVLPGEKKIKTVLPGEGWRAFCLGRSGKTFPE